VASYAGDVGFSGWPTEAVEFFQGLQADNTKAYWSAHKAVYETSATIPGSSCSAGRA
jgi:Conserved hypothetical protein (DUF2461)